VLGLCGVHADKYRLPKGAFLLCDLRKSGLGCSCYNCGMVRVVAKDKAGGGVAGELYQCEECGFHYTEKERANECEAWCKEHKSCNLDIISYAEENKQHVSVANE